MSLPPIHLTRKEVDALMRRDRFNAPLTEEEQIFAEENHFLIAKYLRKRRLPIDEWYDVVIFRYCRSVKRWFALPELHKKRRRRIQTISLDAEVPNTNHLTYKDLVASEDNITL